MKRYGISLIFLALASIAAVLGGSCGGRLTPAQIDQQLYDNFRTAVATAPQDGYTPYWLGRGFEAGGAKFTGPSTPRVGHEVPGGGVSTDYSAPESGSLTLTSYSPAAWAKVDPRFKALTGREVQLAGHTAKYTTSSGGDRPINTAEVATMFGDTVVLAEVHSLGAATPRGPDVNPLIDEQTFLSVLSHLRPYPQ